MRLLGTYIFRALCALLIGFLLVSNPEEMTTLLVQIIGGLFVFSGCVTFISYFIARLSSDASMRPMFPVVGVGSLGFGIFLLLWPDMFVSILMYVLGGILVLAALNQIINLIGYRSVAPLVWSGFVVPVIILGVGLYVLLRPMESASTPFLLLGLACMAYGVAEFFGGIRLHRYQRRLARQDAARRAFEAAQEVAEETSYEEIDTDASTVP